MSPGEKATDYVVVGGLRIGFRRAGEGPPLVLLHGGLGDSRAWRDQIEELSDEFTVVAWDAPGCGASSDPPDTFRLAEYADCLTRFIEVLELSCPHVLGHSFGAGLARELYRRPGITRSLVLAGAYAWRAGSLPAEEVEKRLRLALETAELLLDRFLPSIPGLFLTSPHPTGLRAGDLRDALPETQVPTLLLWGEADRRSPLPVAKRAPRRGSLADDRPARPGS